jgi:hypothetical protein
LGKAGDSFENIAEEKGFAVGVAEKRKEAKFCEGSWKTHLFVQIQAREE